ncbi:RES domain-containing protein [Jiella endophytica]|uniref:RES domain-containing protein n=1 Tax=Jiella endophytica TaxID=2558362 RepID=A0A4Y8RGU2_9HYPH|nr:RES family NAD+ phosphorylase [Jiella endophytica]TFF21868.1 RES domain-containing protein [Jiella endophytica]
MSTPLPPFDLTNRDPLVVGLAAGTIVYRFHTADRGPIFFDPSRLGRLNAPDGSYGVLYAAATRAGAFAETFLRNPGHTLLSSDFISRKALVEIRLTRDLRLFQLHGPGLARVGATAEITHGGLPYDAPQAWSAAIRSHPARFDGIAYTARHDDAEICYGLFDRAGNAIEAIGQTVDLRSADWFFDLLDRYGVGIAPG